MEIDIFAHYTDGIKDFGAALQRICELTTEERNYLFKVANMENILQLPPLAIMSIMENADQRLKNLIKPGDIIAKDEDESYIDLVTYVYDNGAFDVISLSKQRYGRVAKYQSMTDGHYHKTGAKLQKYSIKDCAMYDWE